MKKFAKIITLLLAIVLSISVLGCGSSSDEEKENKIMDKVKNRISVEIRLKYDTPCIVTCNIKLIDSSSEREEYSTKGKVTVYDLGDQYVGEYTATAYYYLDSGDVSVSNINIGKLYRK